MNYNPPNKLLITSDENILQYIKTIKNKSEETYLYKFIKSLSKMDVECSFTELELKRQMNNFFVSI